MSATILVADDDKSIRTILTAALTRLGYVVKSTANVAGLWEMVSAGEGDLVITDVQMPDGDGLDLMPRIRKLRPNLNIVVMSAQNTALTAFRATEQGAFEYLPKPFDLDELAKVVERGLQRRAIAPRQPANAAAEESLPLIGRSPAMQEIYRLLARLTQTDLTVLVSGESGTGKELVARALHDFSRRREAGFVAVNMAAIPRELIESELFGHEKGAFTGATQRHAGRFEQAQGGTLFLDEIGDMPLEAQTRLLRVLQQGEFTPVGGHRSVKADVRIVAATHRDLREQVKQGLFREDLYYRLNVVPVRLPPLRERLEDIPDLVRSFAGKAEETGLPQKLFLPDAMAALQLYRWPGNVRELENLVQRLSALYSEDEITGEAVTAELAGGAALTQTEAEETMEQAIDRHLTVLFQSHRGRLPEDGLYERMLAQLERPLLIRTLKATKGNQLKAAAVLGLNRNTLRKKLSTHGIELKTKL